MPKRKLEGKMNFHWEDLTYEEALHDYEKVYLEWLDFCLSHPDFYNLNLKKNRDIEVVGMGKIMSAGTLILAGGTRGKRKIMKNCRVMIHAVSAGSMGTIHNLQNEMEEIQNIQDLYIAALCKETLLTKRQLKKMLDQKVNVYLTAEEAVEYGLADEVI